MVKVSIGKDQVTFSLDAKGQFLALKNKISIPLDNITDVSTEIVKPRWLSIKTGTHIPKGVYGRDLLGTQRKSVLLCKGFFKMH